MRSLFTRLFVCVLAVRGNKSVFNDQGERNSNGLDPEIENRFKHLEQAILGIKDQLSEHNSNMEATNNNSRNSGGDQVESAVAGDIAEIKGELERLERNNAVQQREEILEIKELNEIRKELKTEKQETSATLFILLSFVCCVGVLAYQYRRSLVSGDVYAKYASRRTASGTNNGTTTTVGTFGV